MMRKLAGRSAFTIFLVGLLSLLLAVPPAHADLWDDYAKQNKIPASSKYLYSYDYIKRSWVLNEYRYGPNYQPVNKSISPSSGLPTNTANTPLSGKIVEPGKTLVRAPSTYIPTALRFGLGGLLGTAGLGIGGTSLAPANSRELALAKGVTAGCYDTGSGCTSQMQKDMMAINSCANLSGASSCASIGATGVQGETDVQKWFRTDALGLLEDLWEKITGQRSGEPNSDGHIFATGRGCNVSAAVEFRPGGPNGNGQIVLHTKMLQNSGRPSNFDPTAQQRWDSACSPAKVQQMEGLGTTQYRTTCVGVNPAEPGSYGKTNYLGGNMGISGSMTSTTDFQMINGELTHAGALCTRSSAVVAKFEILNTATQAQYNDPAYSYGAAEYTNWLNPNPELHFIEDTKLTTSWTCATPDGVQYTYSKSVTKTSALVSPDCPAGSVLLKHDIKSQIGTNPPTTIDSGASNAAEMAKYPDCARTGCAMAVNLDGQPCTVQRTECHTWPEINRTQPSRVGCQWGTYSVPTSDCHVLQDGYRSEAGVVFDPRSGTWTAIDVYGNPLAQNPQPWNPTNPNPTAGTTPGTATPPATGTTPGTGFPGTGSNPQTNDNCSAPGWSWNPVEWVKNPVVCALRDAFEPKTDIAARIGGIKDTAMTKPPLSWMPVFTGPGGGGCPDWSVTVPGFGSKNVVCDSSFTGAIVAARYPMFGLLTAAMIWPLFRSLWYAAIPIMRVHPSR